MKLSDFDYNLPEERIGQHPAEPRDHSRLLVLDRQQEELAHRHFYDLVEYLRPGDALVVNDTRVLPARLIGSREGSGGRVEFLLLRRLSERTWETLVKPGKRLKPGAKVSFGDGRLLAEVLESTPSGGRIVSFTYEGTFESILDALGQMPLPPYITAELQDPGRYQTVYAREQGSAAAPTAGLHFTTELLERLAALGVRRYAVTLHVGLGTFRPVQTEEILEHEMHSEYYQLDAETAAGLNEVRRRGGRIVAVGTTAVRTLETVASDDGTFAASSGWTQIFIYPGYRFKAVDALITNFHLPKSTLLMLVSALAGRERMLAAYAEAVEKGYHFYSFGDAMLIL